LFPRGEKQSDLLAQVAFYAGLGFIIPAAVVLAYALGWLVDQKLGTSPVLAIVMAFVGLAGGIFETVRILTQREKHSGGDDSGTGAGSS
jgi:F0F1-type ATP synthase assembly protein I